MRTVRWRRVTILPVSRASAGVRRMRNLSLSAKCAGALAAGASTILAMPPWSFSPAAWLGFSAFYVLLAHARGARATFLCGWLFGLGYFVPGLFWISNALTVEGSAYSWATPLATFGLPAVLACFPGAAALAARAISEPGTLRGLLAFTGAVALSEWLRGHVLTGFPWLLYGYAWAGVPAMEQSVSLFGIYGLTLLTVAWASLPGLLLIWKGTARAGAALAVTVLLPSTLLPIWGGQRLRANPTEYDDGFILRVVQPSIRQSAKMDAFKPEENLDRISEVMASGGMDAPRDATMLVVWPETAVDQMLMDDGASRMTFDKATAAYPGDLLLALGVLRLELASGKAVPYNSIAVYDRDLGPPQVYDKAHLVPFGEYMPLQWLLGAAPLGAVDGMASGLGPVTMVLPRATGRSVLAAPMICYESIFPGASVGPGPRPGLFLNVTNDAWYGDSAGPRQHFEMARFRSIEEGIPMVRAANNGISAVIDAYGRTLWRTDLDEVTVGGTARPKPTLATTLYGQVGDVPFLLAALTSCLAGRCRPASRTRRPIGCGR